jgi:hypothetical protein
VELYIYIKRKQEREDIEQNKKHSKIEIEMKDAINADIQTKTCF